MQIIIRLVGTVQGRPGEVEEKFLVRSRDKAFPEDFQEVLGYMQYYVNQHSSVHGLRYELNRKEGVLTLSAPSDQLSPTVVNSLLLAAQKAVEHF